MAAVAATYAAIDRGLIGPAFPWIALAGAVEGLCLGGAQAFVLRTVGVRAVRWVAMTVVGAIAGYALSALGGAGSGDPAAAEPALWLMAVAGAGLGLVMGALMGAAQVLALPDRISALNWIVANALGWAPGMAVIMLAASSVGGGVPLAAVAATGAASGVVAGALVGIATWLVLRDAAGDTA